MPTSINLYPLKPIREVYGTTFGTTITSLPSLPSNAIAAMLQVEGQAIRIKFNATDSVTTGVTAGVGGGLLLPVNDINNPWHLIEGWDMMNRARMVSNTSTATINAIYLGPEQPD
jgi:hypothetical protein